MESPAYLVVFAEVGAWEPVAFNHVAEASEESERNISPEDGSQHVEPRVGRAHDLIVRMVRESFVRKKVWECLLERNDSVLHQRK